MTLSEMVQAQAAVQACVPGMQCNQLPESDRRSHDGFLFPTTAPRKSSIDAKGQLGDSTALNTVRFRTSYYETCTIDCGCSCHRPKHLKSPSYLHSVLGSIFVGYVGLPIFSSKCDVFDCNHNTGAALWVDYYFPVWFLNRKIHFSLTNRHNSGPEQTLRVTRIVHATSEIMKFAMQNDIQRMKDLLFHGRGSPYDTDGTNTPLIVRVSPPFLGTSRCGELTRALDAASCRRSKPGNMPSSALRWS